MKRFQRFDPEIQVPQILQQTNKEINSSTFEEDLLAFAFDPISDPKQIDSRRNNRELFKKSIMAQEEDIPNQAKLLGKKQSKNSIQSLLFDARKSQGNQNSKKPNEVTFKNAYLYDGDQRPILNPLANSNLLQSHWDIQDNNCLSLSNFKLEDPKLKLTQGQRFKSIDRVVGALASHPNLPIMNRTLHRRQQIEFMKKTLQSDQQLCLFQNIHSVTNEEEDLLPLLDSNRNKFIEISEQDIFNQTQQSNRISSLIRDSFECENGFNKHMQIKDQLLITSNFRQTSMKSDKVKIINAPTFKQQLQHRKSMQKTLGEKSDKADKGDVSPKELNNITMVSFSPSKQFNWDPIVERRNILDKIYSHQNSFQEITLVPSSEGIRTRNDKQIVVHIQSQTQFQLPQTSEQFQDISSASTPQPITQTQLPKIQHQSQKKKTKERIFQRNLQKQNAEEVLGFGTFLEIAKSRPIKSHRRQTIDQH